MLILISWGLAVLDTQSLSDRYLIWRADQTLKSAERTIQGVNRMRKEIAESDKWSEALDQERRRKHDEFDVLLIKMGFPPLGPLPPKQPRPPG